ncbi:MAG: GWxTD domain-containing protein [Candidatus Aminicenantaceae bacterium]
MRAARFLWGLSLILMCFASCYYYRMEQKLDPENRDWLQRVDYIITSEERKLFLSLPEADREAFREEFWLKRDPDSTTEENELKMEYFDRLEKANELFFSEGREGYRSDRGRIYILYGPPMEYATTPPDDVGRTSVIWYYGNFPVIFVDEFSTGRFSLVTFDLSPLRDLNIKYMHELGRPPGQAGPFTSDSGGGLDFDWDVKIAASGSQRVEGEVEITIPLLYVWFAARGGRMETDLDLRLEVRDAADQLIWEHEEVFRLEVDEAALQEDPKMKHRMKVALLIEGTAPQLRHGTNRIFAVLVNQTGGAKVSKVKTFKLN